MLLGFIGKIFLGKKPLNCSITMTGATVTPPMICSITDTAVGIWKIMDSSKDSDRNL